MKNVTISRAHLPRTEKPLLAGKPTAYGLPMNCKLIKTLIVSIATLSGCGVIDKKITTEDAIKEKASFAIGAQPSEIAISNVKSSGFSKVSFNAEANNVKYTCYYESAIAVKSDAICTKLNGKSDTEGTSNQCNELLKAAGRC